MEALFPLVDLLRDPVSWDTLLAGVSQIRWSVAVYLWKQVTAFEARGLSDLEGLLNGI